MQQNLNMQEWSGLPNSKNRVLNKISKEIMPRTVSGVSFFNLLAAFPNIIFSQGNKQRLMKSA